MGLLPNVADDGFAGLEHNFVTGKVEDLVRWRAGAACGPPRSGSHAAPSR